MSQSSSSSDSDSGSVINSAMAETGVTVVVFGGCGFIGRNLVHYLIESGIARFVRAVDKVPPQVAWMNGDHLRVFNDDLVEFKSSNLINSEAADRCLEGVQFDWAVNCACETKPGQTDPVYDEGIFKVSLNCARAAAKHNVRRYVEISSGQMFSNEKKSHRESDKVEPWTAIARHKYKVEQHLKTVDGLNYIILRPCIVYGIGDKSAIGNRLIIAGLYKYLGETMTLLWNKGLCMNTVHVTDVCRAVVHLATHGEPGEIYNLADDSKTTQGSLTDVLSEVFHIKYDYWGNTASNLWKLDMNSVVDEVNDKHLGPWAKLCLEDGVTNTPLSPYVHKELLFNKHLNLNTDKIKETGFELLHPELTSQLIREILDDFNQMKMFPSSLLV